MGGGGFHYCTELKTNFTYRYWRNIRPTNYFDYSKIGQIL